MPNDQWAAARSWVREQRDARWWSIRQAANGSGVSDQTWANFEKGVTPLTPRMRLAVVRKFEVPADWPEVRPDVSPPATPPRQNSEMLTAILSEIQTHRASDVSPTAILADLPTRGEIRAEIREAVEAVFSRADANNRKIVEALDNLHQAVTAQEHRLRELELLASSTPSSRAPRKRSQQTRT